MQQAATFHLQANGQVLARPGALCAVLLTAGVDAASVTVYDNTQASGNVLAVLKAGAGATVPWTPAASQVCSIGLYAAITGTTPDVFVVYT